MSHAILLGRNGERKKIALIGFPPYNLYQYVMPSISYMRWDTSIIPEETITVTVENYGVVWRNDNVGIYVLEGVPYKIRRRRWEREMSPYYYTETSASTNCATTSTAWTNWSTAGGTTDGTWNVWIDQRPLTATEIAAQQRAAEEAARLRQQEEANRRARESNRRIAEERARTLLLDNLDAAQKEHFEKTGAIPVNGKSGRQYHVDKSLRVKEHDKEGKLTARLCFHPVNSHELPAYDTMLAQKLLLECDEETARKVANITSV